MNLVDNATACDGEPRQSQHVYVVFEIEIVFEIEMFCTIWLVLRLAIITSQPKRVSFAVQVIGWLLRRDNPLSSISILETEGAAWRPRYSGYSINRLLVRRIHMRASRRRTPWTRRKKINRLV